MKRANVVAAVLATSLLGSLGANVALYKMGMSFFTQQNAVRLDPLGLEVYAADTPPPSPAAGVERVVFFGDSRALMWPTPQGLPRFDFVNRGIGYQTTEQILGRLDRDLAPLKPAIVVLELGVNDLKAIPLMPEKRGAIVDHCKANIAKVVSRCRELGARVVLSTIFPLGDIPLSRKVFMSSDVAVAINEVNVALRALAAADVTVLESGPPLDDGSGKVQKGYGVDFLHLSAAGYHALEPGLTKALGPKGL